MVVSQVGRELYEKFFRNYTRKQWGLDPSELDAAVTARVPTRTNRDDRYFTDTYQAMPLHGYTRMFERMLDHPEHQDAAEHRLPRNRRQHPLRRGDLHRPDRRVLRLPLRQAAVPFAAVPVRDARTPSRSSRSRSSTIRTTTSTRASPSSSISPARSTPRRRASTSIRRPRATRTTRCRGRRTPRCTSSTRSWPRSTPGVHFVGRLGTYKYYNMDQVVAQALTTFAKDRRRAPRGVCGCLTRGPTGHRALGRGRCTINRVGDRFLDQLERCGHYARLDDL